MNSSLLDRFDRPRRRVFLALLLSAWASTACSFLPTKVNSVAPPLVDMEEPLDFGREPEDDAARAALPAGSFSGVELAEARPTLDAMVGDARGVEVARVVENSPADVAGLEAGDLILAATTEAPAGGGARREFAWPSEWRALELETPAGTKVALEVDRAGAMRTVELVLVPRVHPAERVATQKWREEERAGVVVRSATEVEARAAGLAPGAGAVVIGLARSSPWRRAGVVFGDVIVGVDGEPLAHPDLLIAAIRKDKERIGLDLARGAERKHVDAPLTRRETELTEITIPILYSYENDRGHTTTSFFLGLVRYERTSVAWRLRLLWLIHFAGGEADKLEEVHS